MQPEEVVVLLMVVQTDMAHDHVKIIVLDAEPPGAEEVPALQRAGNVWELLKSPLYATQVAAGDLVKVLQAEHGTFEIVRRGGNVCVQLFLASDQADSMEFTNKVADFLEKKLRLIDGRVDGQTPGLVSCTVPVAAGFGKIEKVFFRVDAFGGVP